MLSKFQRDIHDVMLHMIEQKYNYCLSSEERGIGKTYTLNELCLTLQALGYQVLILTPFRLMEYYGERFITTESSNWQGIINANSVIVADEAKYNMMDDLLDYCKYRKVPVVGFVNFNFNIPNNVNLQDFQREYECTWVK